MFAEKDNLAGLIQARTIESGGNAESLHIDELDASGVGWIHYVAGEARKQGWKLHVSATPQNALPTADRVVPVLVKHGVSFKVAGHVQTLSFLNAGMGGKSQIGKFITVYPDTDEQAVALAEELHQLTDDLGGPRIPSDIPFAPRSAVHYRYGGFTTDYIQLANGEILPAIRNPDGELVPDRRERAPTVPAWVDSPFPVSAHPPVVPTLVLNNRYVLTGMLSVSFLAQVLAAVDLSEKVPCVIKRLYRRPDADIDTPHGLETEARTLMSLADVPRLPQVIELFHDEEFDYLALSYAGRRTLGQSMNAWLGPINNYYMSWAVSKTRDIAITLDAMHRAGFIHGDVKTSNILVADDDEVTLIDFGSAVRMGGADEGSGGHTPGYVTRARLEGAPLSIHDDIHGLGAVLYSLVTQSEASHAPDPKNLLTRPPRLVNPLCGGKIERIIERALSEDPTTRYTSMVQFVDDLTSVRIESIASAWGSPPRSPNVEAHWAFSAAQRLAQSLIETAQISEDGEQVTWHDPHPLSSGAPVVRDLNVGTGGIVLALAELYSALPGCDWEDLLRKAAWTVLHTPHFQGGPLPGLLVGEAGIGAAATRAGQVLHDQLLIEAGAERIASTAALPHRSPDFFNGTAGRLLAHLIAWDVTGNELHKQAASQAGDALVESMVVEGEDGFWDIPEGFSSLSGTRTLGYSHGAAGIADALLMLYEETQNSAYLTAACHATHWIVRHAVATDEGRVDWPASAGEPPYGPAWCHGSAGIGQFLVRVAKLGIYPDVDRLLCGAAVAAARGARTSSPVQCHGLSGNIEFLLDGYQATGDSAFLAEAQSLGDLLAGWEQRLDTRAVYASDFPNVISPAYWVGYAGVAVSLLRLAEPESRPRQLSRLGFQYLKLKEPA